jgi:stress response protein YsnF
MSKHLFRCAATFKENGSAVLVFLKGNQEKIRMISQFPYRTGLPIFDLFFNGFATIFEMQRALASTGIMTAPMSTKFGYSDQGRYTDQSRRIEIGGTEEQIIPIPREELQIGKRQVQSAKVYRVSTTVVEVPVEEQIKLRAETVVIERRPTTGTTVRGGESFQDRVIEVHEMYEEPVIGKVITQAEEMVIYKTLSERTATIRETVRQTRVNVDGKTKVQVQPPVESPREVSLKIKEQPTVPAQLQVGNVRETSLKAEEHPKILLPPQFEAARDTGTKVDEQKKDQVHPTAEVGVTAGPRHAPDEKSRESAMSQNPGERKDHTSPGGDTKPRRQ